MITIEDIDTLFRLSLDDKDIQSHLDRATWDFRDVEFEDDLQELEVIGSKTIYYLAPLLWVDMQDRAEEYEESLQTFKDIEKFQRYWLERAESAITSDGNESDDGDMKWAAI
jgi:hypothetical protein